MRFILSVLVAVAVVGGALAATLSDSVQVSAYLAARGKSLESEVLGLNVIMTGTSDALTLVSWNVSGVARPGANDWPSVAEAQASLESLRQAAKPMGRKQGENNYLALCVQVLAALNDPRATNSAPTKLSITELETLLTTLQDSNPMAAVVLSIKFLSVNAMLLRYETLWWEDAKLHPEVL